MKDEYKTICDKCGIKTWYEKKQPCKATIFIGCPNCGSHENISTETKCTGTLRVIDNSELDPRLTSYYESGERVEITYKDGSKTRCYIAKSTGWKPCYLEIAKANSTGGILIHLPKDAEVRGTGKYRV